MSSCPADRIWSTLIIFSIAASVVVSESCAQTGSGDADAALDNTSAAKPAAQEDAGHGENHGDRNRLADETSPYLLMHAGNPVDWYPWGDEALSKAKTENKPIFLSIGYSSCHWCHVMERESFMDKEIADFLNANFVCIKVDREERPDIDSIYMTSLQIYNQVAGTGRGGGWPLSMFLTPQAKPFFGGTYFPARDGDRGGAPGFLTIARRVHDAWRNKSENIHRDAQTLTELTKRQLGEGEKAGDIPQKISRDWIPDAIAARSQRFDDTYGGFGFNPTNPQVPKFPESPVLFFLVDAVRGEPDNEQARQMLGRTLSRMADGGIYDHLGDGFHRYSVDRFWRIPHFEKMLYDNAQLASVYAEAAKIFDESHYADVARGILRHVQRDMTDAAGGFYSALDADTDGEEGRTYRWSRDEIRGALDDKLWPAFSKSYGIDGPPNFEHKFHVLEIKVQPDAVAAALNLSSDEVNQRLQTARDKLLELRSTRKQPFRDEKILTSWNGLMIRGFADAGRLLDEPEFIQTAARAAEFVVSQLDGGDGRLWRTHSAGQAKLNAYLDDYAFLINALIALHRATGEEKWLKSAERYQRVQNDRFWDDARGGYFFTSDDHESLLARARRTTSGAVPSGNSVSAENLHYLGQQLGDDEFQKMARRTLLSTADILNQYPEAAPRMLIVVRALLDAEGGAKD